MRNENNLYEWTIILKQDGSLFISHEGIDTTGGAGIVNKAQRDAFLFLALGDTFEKKIESLKNPVIEGQANE